MKQNEINSELIELQEKHDLIHQSVIFWGKQVEAAINEGDSLLKLPETEKNLKKREEIIDKLCRLILKGNFEREILAEVEDRLREVINRTREK